MKSRTPFPKKHDKSSKHRVNQDIRVAEVRLIDADNSLIGIVSRNEALRIAEDRQLDLVEVVPTANPPVCKIIDYGKFLYELQKKEKNQKKNQTQQTLKEIRFKWRTATHDFNFKVKHARTFIEEGNKVKATVIFRGRELAHPDIGRDLLLKFIEATSDVAKIDQPLNSEGRNMAVIISPLKGSKNTVKPVDSIKSEGKQINKIKIKNLSDVSDTIE